MSGQAAPVPRASESELGAPPALTWIELIWIGGRIEHWIRFGRQRGECILDRRRRRVAFNAGDLFGFVRWRASARGTVQSRLDIVRALAPSEAGATVPGIAPGGELLLHLVGWPRVQSGLAVIDAVERLGVHPADAAPDYWRHVHNRLSTGSEPDDYTPARHRAWRLRAAVGP